MKHYLIEYTDPDTGQQASRRCEFEDSYDPEGLYFISAKEWAEDLAYSLADKGWYNVSEIFPPPPSTS